MMKKVNKCEKTELALKIVNILDGYDLNMILATLGDEEDEEETE